MKRQKLGFTLVELMVAVSIAAILIAIAAPNFSNSIKDNRTSSQIRELANALTSARSQAVSSGVSAVLCRSSDHSSCGGTWAQGWIMCLDTNNDNDCSGETILRTYQGIGSNTMKVYHFEGGAAVADTYVKYSHNGLLTNTNSYPVTFAICDAGADVRFARAVLVSSVGRTLLSNVGNGVIAQDSSGAAITCP